MTKVKRRDFLALALGAALLAAAPLSAFAQGLTIDEAAKRVQKETGGRVLSAKTERTGDGTRYCFKVLLPGGRIRKRCVNAGDD